MKKNLSTDLSTITSIPEEIIVKLLNVAGYCIGNAVKESLDNFETITEIDMEFGTLMVKNDENSFKLKFIPNESLNEDIKNSLSGKESLLTKKLEASLSAKLVEVYKEII